MLTLGQRQVAFVRGQVVIDGLNDIERILAACVEQESVSPKVKSASVSLQLNTTLQVTIPTL